MPTADEIIQERLDYIIKEFDAIRIEAKKLKGQCKTEYAAILQVQSANEDSIKTLNIIHLKPDSTESFLFSVVRSAVTAANMMFPGNTKLV